VAGNGCTPLVPKAGDSLTYTSSSNVGTGSFTTKYDYATSTYAGKAALAWTVTSTVNGTTTSAVSYIDPATGAVLGVDTPSTDLVTTFDPVDYQSRVNAAVTTVGQKATVAVKARLSGKSISSAFAAIGGGTALTMDYTYSIERLPNESLTVGAGTYANTCKLQVNVTIGNVNLEGGNTSNPLYSAMFGTLSGAFTKPFETSVWLTNQLPNVPKSVAVTHVQSDITSTLELTKATLVAR
jgi:hypothetical protein